MKIKIISVIGTGYVGLVTAIMLSNKSFQVICSDINKEKIQMINEGKSLIYEPGFDELFKEAINNKLIMGTTDNVNAILDSDITYVCVGTPSLPDGSIDTSAIFSCVKDVGKAIKIKRNYHLIVIKSTVIPGTTEQLAEVIEKYSGKEKGKDFGICMNPEFLRQGSAVDDSFNPDRIIIGELDKKSGDLLEYIYQKFNCPKIRCGIRTAEIIKYASNALLATKISFSNEIARICEKMNVDAYEVMDYVALDKRINRYFLNSGIGFGGSCFPKDLKALIKFAETLNIKVPLLKSAVTTNEVQIEHFISIIENELGTVENKKIAFIGLSFKPNTDDVRETRALPLIKELYKKGANIHAYDPKAIENFKQLLDLPIIYEENLRDSFINADFAIIQTSWDVVNKIELEEIKNMMKEPIIFDARRTFEPEKLIEKGIMYRGIGWKNN